MLPHNQANPTPQRRPRWLTPIIVAMLIVAAAGTYWYRHLHPTGGKNETTNTSSSTNTTYVTQTIGETTKYTDSQFHFSFSYPASWIVTKKESGEGDTKITNIVVGTADTGVTVIVVAEALEGVIRESLSVTSETPQTINGLSATLLSGKEVRSGQSVDLLLFRQSGTLVVVNGKPDLVATVGGTFSFLPE